MLNDAAKTQMLVDLAESLGMGEWDAKIALDLILGARTGARMAFAASTPERAELFRTFIARAGMILEEDIQVDFITVTPEVRQRLRNGGRLESSGKSLCH